MTALGDLHRNLGFEDGPVKGFATTTVSAAVLGALVSKLMGLQADRGAMLGTLGGAAVSMPLAAKSKIDKDVKNRFGETVRPPFYKSAGYPFYDPNTDRFNRPALGPGYLDSPIVHGAMDSLLEDKHSLDNVFRNHIAASLAAGGANAAAQGKREVTIGDIARAGVQAGMGGVGGFVLGTFLGSKNPGTWGLTGAALTGAYSLGKSFGSIR